MRASWLWRSRIHLLARTREFVNFLRKFADVLEVTIDRCEPYIGDRIQCPKLCHHSFPDLQGGQFPLTGRTQLMLDVVNGRFNLVDADRALL